MWRRETERGFLDTGYQRSLLYLGFPVASDPEECKLPLLKGHSEEHSFIIWLAKCEKRSVRLSSYQKSIFLIVPSYPVQTVCFQTWVGGGLTLVSVCLLCLSVYLSLFLLPPPSLPAYLLSSVFCLFIRACLAFKDTMASRNKMCHHAHVRQVFPCGCA